jgi:hypothetical protein
LVSGAKPMRLAQIVGDAAECPLSLFANPGCSRVPQTVVCGTPVTRTVVYVFWVACQEKTGRRRMLAQGLEQR